MKKILLSTVATLLLATSAMATVNNQTGCGLGSQLIKDDSSVVMLSLQATLNGTSGNQTFGITSGTSGCQKTKLVMNETTQRFVASNMDQLSKEIAMGHGEAVQTLAELLKVENKSAFIASLQKNYTSIYTSSNVKMADVLDNVSAI